MDCIKQACRNYLCLDKVTNPVCSVVKRGTPHEKVQAAAGCIGVVCSVICLALGIAAAGTGALVGGFAIGLGVMAVLLGIVLFCMATWDVLHRHGGLGCPVRGLLGNGSETPPEPCVIFTKGKNGEESEVVIVG
ncbi:inclusion membrane protein IncE [Chlamydia suis]|uniref:Inclusion membrane protein IncE n=1 Tax=Chlamydia suis TaxID=83559 RepID=A0AAQ0EQD3_9CHLA|nr:inclusion membrane protein IncE [Chlamydia suis]MEB2680928.1 inclusion membrane protein IncE [Chlamydia suis]MEB2682201.1 inclusion membrane protein IncE [Chlamydia suis]MEB2683126.1 inclusion membrane protein IncE [Chlamydia suis]MEB2683636.1 inclusion membrane protein IncE [Chlamydia suis]MEB2684940.1 inclusion membrane protein IncE [Chlamydia suis]